MGMRPATWQEILAEAAAREIQPRHACHMMQWLTGVYVPTEFFSRYNSKNGTLSPTQTQTWRLFFQLFDATDGFRLFEWPIKKDAA